MQGIGIDAAYSGGPSLGNTKLAEQIQSLLTGNMANLTSNLSSLGLQGYGIGTGLPDPLSGAANNYQSTDSTYM